MSSKIGRTIRWVDGFRVRNFFPDLDLVTSSHLSGQDRGGLPHPYIPKGEVWVDRRFKKEQEFLLKTHGLEFEMWDLPYPEARARLKHRLCRNLTPARYVVRRERRGKLSVVYVRGEIVRQCYDPAFIFGGHDLVYAYIPHGEVWIDVRQDPREVPFVLTHELRERALMLRGMKYHDAHNQAAAEERVKRLALVKSEKGPLKMEKFRQTPAFCGPASLKIAASYFGRPYAEAELDRLARAASGRTIPTPDYGADHAEVVGAARAIGAEVHEKKNATIADLRRWVIRRRIPVIVGWYVDDPGNAGDHYSVVYHLTRTHIHLMDPEQDRGYRSMTIKRFLKLWWDTDTPKNIRTRRWCASIDFGFKPKP